MCMARVSRGSVHLYDGGNDLTAADMHFHHGEAEKRLVCSTLSSRFVWELTEQRVTPVTTGTHHRYGALSPEATESTQLCSYDTKDSDVFNILSLFSEIEGLGCVQVIGTKYTFLDRCHALMRAERLSPDVFVYSYLAGGVDFLPGMVGVAHEHFLREALELARHHCETDTLLQMPRDPDDTIHVVLFAIAYLSSCGATRARKTSEQRAERACL